MARIRTIKPEFPQSESMGRVSRESRLCFVLLWTLADDEGRLRGNSRMLASLLFPYDDDAPQLIDGWLCELESEHCIMRYQVDGTSYLQIAKWLNHQKIDKPSKSKFPAFDESSRILSNPRESYPLDQGSRIKDQGPGEDQGKDQGREKKAAQDKPARFDPKEINLPDCIRPQVWAEWIDYRKARKLSCVENTMQKQIQSLQAWFNAGHDPNQIIHTSIACGWQGLFEPKANPVSHLRPVDNSADVNRRIAEIASERFGLIG